jgi:tRNA (adenine57-N1/adenine58-N1)-methyltransferase
MLRASQVGYISNICTALSPILDITMFESLQRPHDATAAPRPIDVGEISRKLKLAEIKREEKRQRQLAANAAQLTKASATAKRKHDEAEHEDTDELDVKKVKVEDEVDNQVVVGLDQIEEPSAPTTGVSSTEMAVSKVFPEVKGHTSYLTFACLLPACIRDRFEVKAFHSDVDVARAMDVDGNTPEARTEDS